MKAILTWTAALLLLGLSCLTSAKAQVRPFAEELRFAQYLSDKDAFEEAIYVLRQWQPDQLPGDQRDSLRFHLGWNAYRLKQLGLAARNLRAVTPASAYYPRAQFFGHYCLAFDGKVDSAYASLERLSFPDSVQAELQALELAGLALLKRDYATFARHQQRFTYRSYALTNEEKRLGQYADKLKAFPRKSMFLAGLYSAVIPGLGKVYAGKPKQGIAAFLPLLSLGLLTYEGLRKDGVRSARFIGFGSLFTLFYVGNIWGSALAVRVRRNEFNREYDNKILFDLHIPLRNLFD